MSREPEVALVFTPDPWVEDLHRHLSDHGGARVRSLLIEQAAALDETYDVLVAGHRWPGLTAGLVDDLHARGRSVLGVHAVDEPAGREHLRAIGCDATIDADAGADAIVRAVREVAGRRGRDAEPAPAAPAAPPQGRLVVTGGGAGAGCTELAVHLAAGLASGCAPGSSVVLLDADETAPAVAQRLGLAPEPNVRDLIDAVEHGRGDRAGALAVGPVRGLLVAAGLPSARAWPQVRPGEVVRVVDALRRDHAFVVADGGAHLDDLPTRESRARFATARALVAAADALVAVADASPHGLTRIAAWVAHARDLTAAPVVAVVNRAPSARFRRGELYAEIARALPVEEIVFVPHDPRVAVAAWDGERVARGPFTRAADGLVASVRRLRPGRLGAVGPEPTLDVATVLPEPAR